ncbi:hypothetical protein PENTCL1PPCAC_10675, partial [Pristionchus entomophagus]
LLLVRCMFLFDKLKVVCGFDSPKMDTTENSPPVVVNQHVINCAANIAFVEDIWNQRYSAHEIKMDISHTNSLRAEYHKLFMCISRCQKMTKRLDKEKLFMRQLVLCKEQSVPQMAEVIENLSKRIPPTHPIPYMWNHDEQREVIGNLNMKWEELALQDYLSNFDDDEDSDTDMSFDEKYGIVKTKLSDIAMNSLGTLFNEQRARRDNNERLKNEVLALEREERQLQRQVQECCTELLQPFPSMKTPLTPEMSACKISPRVSEESPSTWHAISSS